MLFLSSLADWFITRDDDYDLDLYDDDDDHFDDESLGAVVQPLDGVLWASVHTWPLKIGRDGWGLSYYLCYNPCVAIA